jgi:hypothetical protein
MSEREKKLGLAVLAVLLLFGGKMGWDKFQSALQAKRSALSAAEQDFQSAELELEKAKIAAEKVRNWEEQSLPRDRSVAQSLYRSWLIDQLEASKVRYRDVAPAGTGSRATGAYEGLAFNIEGEGDLASVVRFLHAFHRSNALHKITLLSLRPSTSGSDLQVTINVEALLLPNTIRKSGMPEGVSDRLAEAEVEHYLKSIVARNPFVAYKPPPPKIVERPRETRQPPPAPPAFDESSQARLTGIVQAGPQLQAWVKVLTTNENLRLVAGDELKVGKFEGKVVEVRPQQMVIEVEGERQIIPLGKFLREGVTEKGEI